MRRTAAWAYRCRKPGESRRKAREGWRSATASVTSRSSAAPTAAPSSAAARQGSSRASAGTPARRRAKNALRAPAVAARWPPLVGLPGSCGALSGVASRRQRARQREVGSPPPGSCGSSSARWSSERRAPSDPAPIAANRLASAASCALASCADDAARGGMSGGSDALIGSRAIVVATRFAECSPECEPAAAAGAAAAEAAGGVGLQLSMLRLCVGDGGSGASGGGGAGGEPSSSIGLERSEDGLPPPPPHAAAGGLPEGGGVAGGGGLTSWGGGLASSASAIASGSLCSRVTSVRHSCCASVVEKKPRYSSFALCFTCAAADGGGGRRDAGEPGSSVKSTILTDAVDDVRRIAECSPKRGSQAVTSGWCPWRTRAASEWRR